MKSLLFRTLYKSMWLLFLSSSEVLAQSDKAACPVADETPAPTFVMEMPELNGKPVDANQDLKDISTKIVVKDFFTTHDTIYNFIKLVYQNIDDALAKYRKLNKLDDRAIILVFKGGNVLRMVANGVFKLLPVNAKNILEEEYVPYFQRSDTDFSVYLDEKKLGNLDYEAVLNEVTDLIFSELNKIREEFKANPQKYFNFFRLNETSANKELGTFFDELKGISATKDKTNENWYSARFEQLQILDKRARPDFVCPYQGSFDYKYEVKDNKIVSTLLSTKADWIVNSDNRTIEAPLGSDPNKFIKFYLVRSKVAFEYFYRKDDILKRKIIGGELIDVSIDHKKAHALRKILDNYDKKIAQYTLFSPDKEESFTIKSYSPAGLADDLLTILFEPDRPWHGGQKYEKRVNRFFFIAILEMLYDYGLYSDEANLYLYNIKEKILKPLKSLYPLSKNSFQVAERVKNEIENIVHEYGKNMAVTNRFWQSLGHFLQDQLVKKPQNDDKEGFLEFLGFIEKNIDIASKLSELSATKRLPLREIFKVGIGNIF